MTEEQPRDIPARIESRALAPGLYLVATPIGAARDITLRALDVLNSAEILAAEDTRTLRHLMDIHGIPLRGRRMIAYHDHSSDRDRRHLLDLLGNGASVAYASEAGTPLVADPGYKLAREAGETGASVHAVPGASAMLAALSVSGLPSDRFLFAGFPPTTEGARRQWLGDLAKADATTILYESPRRVKDLLEKLCETEGERGIALCRELTKKFEQIMRGTVQQVLENLPQDSLRGEIVLVLDRARPREIGEVEIQAALRGLLDEFSVKDAAAQVAAQLGLARRDVYQLALKMGKDGA